MSVTEAQIREQLATYIEPNLKVDLISAKVVKDISINADQVAVDIQLGYPANSILATMKIDLEELLLAIPKVNQARVNLNWQVNAHGVQQGVKSLKGVKNIIAIASGKGGVGKSTTAVNLALALASEGARVGILDADIYGPNQPAMLGAHRIPRSNDSKTMEPVISHGLQSMSIGYLIDETTPMVWRGPMVSSALQQLLYDTNWDNLEYLIVDLPPGTGDVQITLAQKIPVTAAVIVTTPQDIALADARKAIGMFAKVKVPVLGVIENMSIHVCKQCGHQEAIFGQGGGSALAQQYTIDFLGKLPLDALIRQQVDSGTPTVVAEPQSKNAKSYRDIARNIAGKLSLQAKDYSSKFPNIVVHAD